MKSKVLKIFHAVLLPAVFLLSFVSAEGQSITTYYPKVDKKSLDYIHIMKVVVEPTQVYVVFRYNVLGNDRIALGSQTTLRCGSFISTIHQFGILSDSIQRVLPFDTWFSLTDPENIKYASKPFVYVDKDGEEKISRSFDFFMVFKGRLPEYAHTISILESAGSYYENAGSHPFNWEGIHINNFHTDEEW